MLDPVTSYLSRLAISGRRVQRTAILHMLAYHVGALSEYRSKRRNRIETSLVSRQDWRTWKYQDVVRLRAYLVSQGLALRTVNRYLSALRCVLREAWRLGYIDREAYERAADVSGVRGRTLARGRVLGMPEVRRLLAACDTSTPVGARDGAVIAVLVGSGLRREELCGLRLCDLNMRSGRLMVQRGKGRRPRVVWVVSGLEWIRGWLAHRGCENGPLFLHARGGSVQRSPLSGRAVHRIIEVRAKQAGIEKCGPHDLRRTFATTLLDKGVDLLAVQRLLGHSSPETTAIYDRRSELGLRPVVARLKIPRRA